MDWPIFNILKNVVYQFEEYQDDNLKLPIKQYRVWSDCKEAKEGWSAFVLVAKSYHFGSSREKVNATFKHHFYVNYGQL